MPVYNRALARGYAYTRAGNSATTSPHLTLPPILRYLVQRRRYRSSNSRGMR